jgi:hypothetical protein
MKAVMRAEQDERSETNSSDRAFQVLSTILHDKLGPKVGANWDVCANSDNFMGVWEKSKSSLKSSRSP